MEKASVPKVPVALRTCGDNEPEIQACVQAGRECKCQSLVFEADPHPVTSGGGVVRKRTSDW
jgi:hypothetical protein